MVGYDNARGFHHRHYFGVVEPIVGEPSYLVARMDGEAGELILHVEIQNDNYRSNSRLTVCT